MSTKKVIHLFNRKECPTAIIHQIDIQEFAGYTACGKNCNFKNDKFNACKLDIIDMSLRYVNQGESLSRVGNPVNKNLLHRTELCEALQFFYEDYVKEYGTDYYIEKNLLNKLKEYFKMIDNRPHHYSKFIEE